MVYRRSDGWFHCPHPSPRGDACVWVTPDAEKPPDSLKLGLSYDIELEATNSYGRVKVNYTFNTNAIGNDTSR